jgi:hypothetical protein
LFQKGRDRALPYEALWHIETMQKNVGPASAPARSDTGKTIPSGQRGIPALRKARNIKITNKKM